VFGWWKGKSSEVRDQHVHADASCFGYRQSNFMLGYHATESKGRARRVLQALVRRHNANRLGASCGVVVAVACSAPYTLVSNISLFQHRVTTRSV
jgi:hypothetical protein